MTAGHALAATRLQLRWRCKMHAAKVARRRRFLQARPAACCPDPGELSAQRERYAHEIARTLDAPSLPNQWGTTLPSEHDFRLSFEWQPELGQGSGRSHAASSLLAPWM